MIEDDKNKIEKKLCSTPNQHAGPATLEVRTDGVVFHGYQEFFLSDKTIAVLPEDIKLQIKHRLLSPYFTPRFLARRSLLDLGANAAFYCFWGLQGGAEKTIAIDIDEEYLKLVAEAKQRLKIENLEVVRSNVEDWQQPADVVVALALIHWIYSCSAVMGSLDAVIAKLSALTNYMLIVEWIAPEDDKIQFFHHLDWNQEQVVEAYTFESFEAALGKHFCRYQKIGDVSPTRSLYVAFRSPVEIDLSCPLPLIKPKDSVISSRILTLNNGAEYWSVVYDDGFSIYKQTSFDLAQREGLFLRELAGGEYFPALKDVFVEPTYSIIELEKIRGVAPAAGAIDHFPSAKAFYDFIVHSLNLLAELKGKGITHRDIRPENLLIRDGKPVLLDFGWAVSERMPYFTPAGMAFPYRPPDGSFCDVYSMGMVLSWINNSRYPVFDSVLRLMTMQGAELRVTDIATLKELFAIVWHLNFEKGEESMEETSAGGHKTSQVTAYQLFERLNHFAQKVNWLEAELQRLRDATGHLLTEKDQALAEKDQALAEKDQAAAEKEKNLSAQLFDAQSSLNEIIPSKAWKIALLIRRVRVAIAPPDSMRFRLMRRLYNVLKRYMHGA